MKMIKFGTLSEKPDGDGMIYSGFKIEEDESGPIYLEQLITLIKQRLDADLAEYKETMKKKGIK